MQARVDEGRRGARWQSPDWRRTLQLLLATAWLLDGVLQLQPFMFRGGPHGFPGMLAESAAGNPHLVASSIVWAAGVIGAHQGPVNLAFALVQILLGLGVAWRRSLKAVLAASVPWSVAVWWFGEGLGGVLHGAGGPVLGGPGAVLIYAALAVVLWPPREARAGDRPADAAPHGLDRWRSAASGGSAAPAARPIWACLWTSMAVLSVLGGARSPSSIGAAIAGVEAGEPGWLANLDRQVSSVASGHGLAAAVAIAAACLMVAAGAYLPPAVARWSLALGIAVSLALWVVTENFGAILAGGATDPSSGPLLVVLALAYWPVRADRTVTTTSSTEPVPGTASEGALGLAGAGLAGAGAGLAGAGLAGAGVAGAGMAGAS